MTDLENYNLLVQTNPDFARTFFVKFWASCTKYGERQQEMAIRLAATAYKNYLYLPFGYDEETWM